MYRTLDGMFKCICLTLQINILQEASTYPHFSYCSFLFIVSFRLLWNVFHTNPPRAIFLMMSHKHWLFIQHPAWCFLLSYISGFYFFSSSHMLYIVTANFNVYLLQGCTSVIQRWSFVRFTQRLSSSEIFYRAYSHSLSLLKRLKSVSLWESGKILPAALFKVLKSETICFRG